MTAPKPNPQKLLDARGRVTIERRGVRRGSLAHDAYHFLRTASWLRIMVLFGSLFLVSNLVFALVLYAAHADIMNASGFVDYYWFSVQTLATIGYGYLAPHDNFANTIVTIESFFGIVFTALVTGVFFARFSTPSARVLFSNRAIISDHDGRRVFQFRMANERSTAIVEATVRVYLLRDERLADGEMMRRVYDVSLRRSTSPVFALSFLVVHNIDETSPFAGLTNAEALRDSNVSVIVTFTGIDDQLAATVHSRYVYTSGDIVFDHKYADLFKLDPDTGARYLDLAPLNDTIPVTSLAGQAALASQAALE